MSKVFICYSSRDHVFTHKLVAELRRHDIEVWFDGLSLGVGDSLIQKIGDAITNADYVLAVISSNSINSEWVNRELRLALSREFMETGVKVLPLLLDRCKVPPFSIRQGLCRFQ
jgi:TIR domain.